MKIVFVKSWLFILALFLFCPAQGQVISEESAFISKLKLVNIAPDGLLSSRTAVLFSTDCSETDLNEIQKGFQQIGIDAVLYAESERSFAGRDLTNAYGNYFARRAIKFCSS